MTLGAILGNQGVAPNLTMRQYLAGVAADTSCTANFVVETAKQIRDFWALREVAGQCEFIRAGALMPGARPRELISSLIQDADAIRATLHGRNSMGRSASEAAGDVVARIERQQAGEIVDMCLTTGLRDLDRKLIGGFKAGELIVVAGRPGMGKSIFATSVARQAAVAGYAGGLFSLEMPEAQITARLLSDAMYDAGHEVSASNILQNQLTERQREGIYLAEREFPKTAAAD